MLSFAAGLKRGTVSAKAKRMQLFQEVLDDDFEPETKSVNIQIRYALPN